MSETSLTLNTDCLKQKCVPIKISVTQLDAKLNNLNHKMKGYCRNYEKECPSIPEEIKSLTSLDNFKKVITNWICDSFVCVCVNVHSP